MSEKISFAFTYNTVEYVGYDGKTGEYAEITGCIGETEKLILPEKIGELEVKSVGRGAFKGCGFITEAVIPDTVRDIGFDAFANCSALTAVKIPSKAEYIGNRAFMGCPMKSVKLSPDVGVIGRKAFGYGSDGEREEDFRIYCGKYSSAFKYATENGFSCITEEADPSPFGYTVEEIDSEEGSAPVACLTYYCGDEENVAVPAQLGGYPVKIIDSGAFANTGVVSVVIPECTEKILSGAFRDCTNLKTVTLPKNHPYIAEYAFYGCGSVEFCDKKDKGRKSS